jgi:Zn-dependent peptidase ImmA (M78 family)
MSSTVSVGDALEKSVYDYFSRLIEEERFPVRRELCRIYQKKGYYSKDREAEIIFDVSIETFFPGQSEYSCVYLIECKNYTGSVKVDELEEFHAKAQQVASANSKAILVTTNSFQSGARRYAKSKGIGLARFFSPEVLKWDLMRSPSSMAISGYRKVSSELEASLALEQHGSKFFDFAFESSARATHSLWDFFEDLLREFVDEDSLAGMLNERGKLDTSVPYVTPEQIEDISSAVVAKTRFVGSVMDLDAVAGLIPGLRVVRSDAGDGVVLGVASFGSKEIVLFADQDKARSRFTYAHELSHFLLEHGAYMRRDTFDASDTSGLKGDSQLPREVRRMEYQANLLASSILMPRQSFIRKFLRIANELGLQDRGFGYIYYDDQPCNARDFLMVTSELMRAYSVSRAAVRIRLEVLGFLTNAQGPQRASANEVLRANFDG